MNNIGKRLLMYVAGLFVMTVGIAISVKSNLGVSPVSSIPYTMTCIWGIEMGKATIILHIFLVLLQIVLLRRNFKPKNLLQIPVGVVFGYFTTFCNWGVSFLPDPNNIIIRLLMMLLSVVFIAFGIFLYMPPNIMPLAGEGAVKAVSDVTGVEFPKVKIGFDISMVLISLIACLVFIKSLGSVGIGTVIAAVLVGTVLGIITKWFGASRDRWLGREEMPIDEAAESTSGNYVITISREYGSGGREIGRLVADKLGISYYDLDVIRKAAKESGIPIETIEENEQNVKNPTAAYLLNWCVQSTTVDQLPTVERIFHAQTKAIREIAEKESCVIVGRLANHILKGHVKSFNVFIGADMESKIKQVTVREGLTETEAKEKIEKVENERANHCMYFTHKQWRDVRNYDFYMKSDLLGWDAASEMIVVAAKKIIV